MDMQSAVDETTRDQRERPRDFNATSNESSDEILVGVDLYTVVVCFSVLLSAASCGILGNISVLWVLKRRRHKNTRDFVAANLCVFNLLVCAFFLPLEFATVAENYVRRPLPGFLCVVRECAYHSLVVAIVTNVVLLVVCQWRSVHKVEKSTTTTSSPVSGENRTRVWSIKPCMAIPLIAGLLTALGVGVQYVTFFDREHYELCQKSALFWKNIHESEPWRLQTVLAVFYLCSLLFAGVCLVTAYYMKRKYFVAIFRQSTMQISIGEENRGTSSESRKWAYGVGEKNSTDETSKPTFDESSTAGASIAPSAAVAKAIDGGGVYGIAESFVDDKFSDKKLNSKNSSQQPEEERCNVKNGGEQEAEEHEEEDDAFDLKMRLEFQKKSRTSSGRRHTVANIALPDMTEMQQPRPASSLSSSAAASSGRRARPSTMSKTVEYHYVRKWSVDITALANQLENPKMNTGSVCPLNQTAAPTKNLDAAACCKSASMSSLPETEERGKISTGNAGTEASNDCGGAVVEDKGENKKMKESEKTEDICDQIKSPPEADGPTLNEAVADGLATNDRAQQDGAINDKADDNKQHDESSVGGRSSSRKSSIVASQEDREDPEKQTFEERLNLKELRRTFRTTILVFVSLLLTLPYVLIIIWPVVGRVAGEQVELRYNLEMVFRSVAVLQTISLPLLIVWSDEKLLSRFKRLWRLTHDLRCLCFCNVGRGRDCFRIRYTSYRDKNTAAPAAPAAHTSPTLLKNQAF